MTYCVPMRKFLAAVMILAHLWPITATAADCSWDQAPGWVARENQKAGNKDWSKGAPLRFSADFSRRKDVPRIEGFVSASSATCGDAVLPP